MSGPRARRQASSGLALVLVVVVLAAIVAVAAPFVLSMRLQERTADGFNAETRAELAARAARELGVLHAMKSHPDLERAAAVAGGTLAASGEDWDDLDELLPQLQDLSGATTFRVRDPLGTMIDVRVEDEQGKIDLRTAPADVVANLLGVAVLLEAVDEDARELLLDDATPFFADGDAETLDGLLWLSSGELCAYADIVPEPVPGAPDQVRYRVLGLVRGAYLSAPDVRALRHPGGSLVRDARGLKVAAHPYWMRLGRYTPFLTVAAIREIAAWPLLDLYLAALLDREGYTLQDLQELGLGGEVVRTYGAVQALEREAAREEARRTGRQIEQAERPPEGEGEDDDDADRQGRRGRQREEAAPPDLPTGDRMGPGAAERVVDQARRRMGRREGEAWLEKALREVDASSEQAKQFVEMAKKVAADRAAYERGYFASAEEKLGRLAEAREIEVLSARELERIRQHLTVHATRPTEWAGGARVLNRVEPDPDEPATALVIGIHIPEARRGLAAMVKGPGGAVEYRRITGYTRPQGARPGQVLLYPQLAGTYDAGDLRVYAAPIHPINVNTASRETLTAVLTGLALGQRQQQGGQAGRGGAGGAGGGAATGPGAGGAGSQLTPVSGPIASDQVTPREAAAVAERLIAAAPIDGPEALRTAILAAAAAGEISGVDAMAIELNALDPNSPRLQRRTIPFTFTAGGTYTVEGVGVVNNPAGVELARRVVRDVVAVGPARSVTLHLDSQADFFARYRDPDNDQEAYRRDGRRGNLLELSPVPLAATQMRQWPSRSHDPGVGRIRLDTGEIGGQQGQGGTLFIERFRNDLDGQRVQGGGYSLAPAPLMDDWYGTWPTQTLAPGWFECWVQIGNVGGAFPILDVGQRDDADRLVLSFDGARRELVLACMDAAIEPIVCAEVRAPFQPLPDQWYHLAACWKGSRPGDLALFVDGLPVGKEQAVTHLAAAIDPNAVVIPVRSTAGFPPVGAIKVGTEVVEYDAITGAGFRVVNPPPVTPPSPTTTLTPAGRGARGSAAIAHVLETPVTVWGYTNFFVAQIPGLPFDLARIRRGGSVLAHPLPRDTPLASLFPPGGPAAGLVFENETTIPTVPQGTTLAARGFPPRGFLHIHHELVYYDRLTDYTFENCVRLVYGWIQDDQLALVPPPNPPNPLKGYRAYTPVFLASIEVADARDYEDLDMLPPGGRADILRGFWLAIEGASPQQKEWVRYRKAESLVNPLTQAPDPRWQNILICCDTAAGFGLQPNTGGRTNAISPGDRQWPRADDWQPDGAAKFQALLARLQAVSGGAIPPLFLPGHMHIGMEWGRNLWQPEGSQQDHPAGARVLPLYALTRPYCGPGDRVTILDGQTVQPIRAELIVHRDVDQASLLLPGGNAQRLPFALAGFLDYIPARPYDGGQGCRLVKRPSGQLPLMAAPSIAFGAPRQGGELPTLTTGAFDGRIDEVRLAQDEDNAGFTPQAEGQLRLGGRIVPESMPAVGQLGAVFHQALRGPYPLGAPVGVGDTDAVVAQPWQGLANGVNTKGHAIRFDEEVVGVTRFAAPRLTEVQRGLLGTAPAPHSPETPMYLLPFPPHVRLSTPITNGGRIEWSGVHPDRSYLPRRGYLMLDARGGGGVQELLPFEPDRGQAVRTPLDDRLAPCYRGAFGTAQTGIVAEGQLAFVFPYRHHDRFRLGTESDEGAFFQATFSPPGASTQANCLFGSIEWDEVPAGADVDTWVLARIDGSPGWEANPTNQPGGLYRFDDPRADNRIDVPGRTIEVRVVFPFRPGAYSRGGWKQSPRVDAVRVRYAAPAATLASEDAS